MSREQMIFLGCVLCLMLYIGYNFGLALAKKQFSDSQIQHNAAPAATKMAFTGKYRLK